MRLRIRIAFLLALGDAVTYAQTTPVLPYAVTLRAQEANVRVGPGRQYPLSWKFVRSGIPLIVLAEVGIWRKIQDAEGEEGWIHQNMLTMRRSALVIEKTHSLLDKPSADAQVVAYLEPGTSAQLQEIRGDWLRVKVERLTGWLHRSQTWGVLKGEKDRRF